MQSLEVKSLDSARELNWVQSWEKTGLLEFDDKNGDGILSLRKSPAQNEITIDRDIIVLSTPEVAGLSPWVIALVAAGSLAAALATAELFLALADRLGAKKLRPLR